ncbi:hypothetical protein [Alkalihalobacillus sp. BA299]|uniref:hypothetical protein n=1 Tax=Alkalihalobacillus sp. BA299 TaxID=2815938 RepID=UPI001ADC4DC1|nr:hypothetical protein [Alkalihalobacillus sp. BA299]
MKKQRKSTQVDQQKQIIANQNQTGQFTEVDTEFSLDESVQEAVAKSRQYEAKNQQPTYEPNKPF